ncbi:Tyrosine-protein kinase masK [Myxococcus hansupus]|uniref:Tyrosine-protein kinase masK n=2 Tax=Pseudomyxococcus hansupus TaxID=1297742 RepID=A0A0H4X9L2_9BACT|nr:tetratricopeptide repeat protein [Myxococcus hansupus]AKQ70275.1 Tyrosine-protein kinase masK [Myxococcus hansupus]
MQEAEGVRKPGMRRGRRSLLVVCTVAVVIHLVPLLLLPRTEPEQQLFIARAMSTVPQRVAFLRPMKDDAQATTAELREAASLLLGGAPDEAHALALEAERRGPEEVETQLLLARICDVERMSRCVRTALSRAESLAPGDARPDVLRAELLEKSGDVAGAADSLEKAHGKAPEDALIGLRYVGMLSAARRGDEALAVLRKLEGHVPPARILVEQGRVHGREGRDAEAVKLFRAAVAEDPKLSVGHFELGLAWHRLGRLDAAEEALRRADRLALADPKALAALCAIQLKEQRIDDARLTRMDLERRFSGQPELIRQSCSIP